MVLIETLGKQAKTAARKISVANTGDKNRALYAIAEQINLNQERIITENSADIASAKKKGLDGALLDRLLLTSERVMAMVDGIRQIAALPDPVGEITGMRMMPKGLQVGRMRAPLGIIGIIYESRPNVTADAAALCVKSGNATILRGGSEALRSNSAIMHCIQEGLKVADLPVHAVQLVPDSDRAHVSALLNAHEYIDVIIPRGGKGLVNLVNEQARMPVIKHLDGICHIYVDRDAEMKKALRVCDNGKTYRFGICGATETLLVHQAIAARFLPKIADIYQQKHVEIRGCLSTCRLINHAVPASDKDWATEYLAGIISIKIVDSYEDALDHIATYSSQHTDTIVTENITTANHFMRSVDSASVMVNTPTCFADGYEYGLGAEIGISTDKIHWRGPVGLEGLTSEKFIIVSDGATR